jgi:hypothetical protein
MLYIRVGGIDCLVPGGDLALVGIKVESKLARLDQQ